MYEPVCASISSSGKLGWYLYLLQRVVVRIKWVNACQGLLQCLPYSKYSINVNAYRWVHIRTLYQVDCSSPTACLLIPICLKNSKNNGLHHCSHVKTVAVVECSSSLLTRRSVWLEDCVCGSRRGRTCGWPFEALHVLEDVKAACNLIFGLASQLLLSLFFPTSCASLFSLLIFEQCIQGLRQKTGFRC